MTCLPISYHPGQSATSLPFLSLPPQGGGLKEVEIQKISEMIGTDLARWKEMDVSEM